MRIYTPVPSENYELCHPVSPEDFEKFHILVNGRSVFREWAPIKVEIVREDRSRALMRSDAPWLGSHALIFRHRAVEALDSLLRGAGELLPLICHETELVVYNANRVIDALDEDASTIVRFQSGRIMHISRYEFRSNVTEGGGIFKIPNLRVSPTFVSQAFVELWNCSRLKGLEFKLVWSNNGQA